MKSYFNFTKKTLNKLPIPEGRAVYHDTVVKGLSLRIYDTGTISFFVRGSANGERVINPLGKYPNVTIDQARVKAREALNLMASGANPKSKAKVDDSHNITLELLLESYIKSRGTNLKENTINNYRSIFDNYFDDWRNKKLLSIKQNMVEKKHRAITAKSPSRANTSMRLLRALFNYAKGEYQDAEDMPIYNYNPTHILTHIKAWNRETRKQTVIKYYDLKEWFSAVNKLPDHQLNNKKPNQSETVRDFLLLVLFTGLRRREASNLKWADIDFKDNTIIVRDTKNYDDHMLPITDFMLDILNRRKLATSGPFVFEGTSTDQPMDDPKKQIEKIRKISGVDFTTHDLRRTFITTAESIDIPAYSLKKLLNHKDPRDVTAGYIIINIERLREPMQKITNYILAQVK